MMEVQRHSVQSVRRSEKRFSPAGGEISPSVSTGLSLGVNGTDNPNPASSLPNTGYVSSVTSMRTPLPTSATVGYETQPSILNSNQGIPTPPLVPVGTGDSMSLVPPGIISGNQAVFLSDPNAELPASLPIGGFGTMPMAPDVPFAFRPENQVIVGDLNQSLPRDVPHTNVAVPDDEKSTRIIEQQFDKALEPESAEGSTPDLNIGYNDGETQVVSESQFGADMTQTALAGETQPVNDPCFDDMIVLQNDTLTASTMPVEDDSQPASLYEPLQIVNIPPLEAPLDATTSPPSGITESKALRDRDEQDTNKEVGVDSHSNRPPVREAEPSVSLEGRNHSTLDKEGLASVGGKAGKAEGLDTSAPLVGVPQHALSEGTERKADENAAVENKNSGNPGTAKKEVVTEQDNHAILGRKVMKKFGRKNYRGEVLDYDPENQWFKVVYEDGDQEDLELMEVKEILLRGDNISETPSTKRKKPLAQGGARNRPRKQKTKSQGSGKLRGRPKKKGPSTQAKKKPQKEKHVQESKLKDSGTKGTNAGVETEQSQVKSRGKRKRSTDAQSQQQTRAGGKVKTGRKNRSSTTKLSVRKSPPKKGGRRATQKGPAKAKGTKRRSLSKLPAEQTRGKRRKYDVFDDPESLVGKPVEKNFDGTLYKGKVMEYDGRSEYYKVKYEDDDQEDLELEELKVVLVE